ncbi:MAG: RNA chaperone Hfq [Clostridioides sp.]|jgi:host factor-I protein|nr:RNA chaperone Hfq [Clostridioides sp.]
MVKSTLNLQDLFLNTSRKERVMVTVSLLDGTSLEGTVKGFDSYIVLLEKSDKSQHLIYKHAISQIKPSKAVVVSNNQGNNQNR